MRDALKYKTGFIIGICTSYMINNPASNLFIFPVMFILLSILEILILQYKK